MDVFGSDSDSGSDWPLNCLVQIFPKALHSG